MEDRKKYEKIINGIDNLYIYNNIKNNKIIKSLYELSQNMIKNKEDKEKHFVLFIRDIIKASEKLNIVGDSYETILIKSLLDDENEFSIKHEKKIDISDSTLYSLAKKDIEAFYEIIKTEIDFPEDLKGIISDYKSSSKEEPYKRDEINLDSSKKFMESLLEYYKTKGCGDLSRYPMFRYDSDIKKIIPIENPDLHSFDTIIGYEYQKEEIKKNTEAFLADYKANNVLLVGSRGTGKSTCIKSLPELYFQKGLRIVEIKKEQIIELSEILKVITKRGQHFIIFIDDLSFEDFEIEYKYMKSLIEGSVEAKPSNVLFYATSNRRHIIQEKWGDKNTNPDDEEIHTSDMINEKLSLSDRFGITLTFAKPSPEEYIKIVNGIAKEIGVEIDAEELKKKAFKWELTKGISGRTARQFVNNLLWETKKKE